MATDTHVLDASQRLRVRDALAAKFGARLRDVVLFGSEARGDGKPDSDVDILVVLEPTDEFGVDLDGTVRALYSLQLEFDRPIHALPVSLADYEAGSFALYRNARLEGSIL